MSAAWSNSNSRSRGRWQRSDGLKSHRAAFISPALRASGRPIWPSVSLSPPRRVAAASSTVVLADLITSLEEAKAAGRLGHRLKTLTYPSLLVADEIGCLSVSQTGATSTIAHPIPAMEHAR